MKVSVGTVSYTIQRQLETGRNSDRKRSGRPKVTTQSDGVFLRATSLCDRRLTAQQLQAQLNLRKALLKEQNRALKYQLWTTADLKKNLTDQ
uniref:Uncharacterized protein n=1 Tax=Erpetoichthys calabaricus TaxID=27687 RepID=A0A8C4THI6_ERPCA